MEISRLHLYIFTILIYFNICNALECYVCTNQDDNVEKCLTTIKTCESDENACLTEIRWGSTPYWTQGALKQYFVSKRCSKKEACVKARQRSMKYCTHIWYEDWACSDCCLGDRCNYFVINATSRQASGVFILLAPLLLSLLRL